MSVRAVHRVGVPKNVWLYSGFALVSLIWFGLLASHLIHLPPDLSSDDAYFFARALTRFSILDFSPHFPGYPAFVALGRLALEIWPDPDVALIRTTISATLLLPAAAAAVAWRWTGSLPATGICFVLVLSQPILSLVAMSGLSDSTGMLFLLGYFALLPDVAADKRRTAQTLLLCFAAGIALGISGSARPSYALILLAAFLPVAFRSIHCALAVIAGALAVAVPSLLVLVALEGTNYFIEGWRFFKGHMFGWGNTVFAGREQAGWSNVIQLSPLFACAVLLFAVLNACCLTRRPWPSRQMALGASVLVAAVWTLFFQNPENLRHLLPFLTLSSVLLAVHLPSVRGVPAASLFIIFLNAVVALPGLLFPVTSRAPIAAAADVIDRIDGDVIVVTNRDVTYLRSRLETARVYDQRYPASARAALSASGAQRVAISRQPDASCASSAYRNGRFFGEPGLWICMSKASPG
ncbi:MAG: hypothetical protein AAGF82_13560 [Pseudomonadota bacterium]